jgi:hypothetical protein
MPGSSILPVALHNGKLYFLFGKENPMEDSARGFSDFGGGVDAGESLFEAAMREGSEELTGFLGNPNQLKSHIKKNGGTYKIVNVDPEDPERVYTIHVFQFDYDPLLPEYYNRNHQFLWNRMNKRDLNSSKLFEKIEIDWFCETELKRRMSEYRPFYRKMVRRLIAELPEIRKFLAKCIGKSRRRGKNRSVARTKDNRSPSKRRNRTIRGGKR